MKIGMWADFPDVEISGESRENLLLVIENIEFYSVVARF
jgi:hypothetical protein